MLDLGEVGIGVAVVDERVEVVGGLPDAFPAAVQAEKFLALCQDKVEGLMRVVLSIEFGHAGVGLSVVVAELFLGLSLFVAAGNEIVPVVEMLKRVFGGYAMHAKSPPVTSIL